jgi:hypothetical protein
MLKAQETTTLVLINFSAPNRLQMYLLTIMECRDECFCVGYWQHHNQNQDCMRKGGEIAFPHALRQLREGEYQRILASAVT